MKDSIREMSCEILYRSLQQGSIHNQLLDLTNFKKSWVSQQLYCSKRPGLHAVKTRMLFYEISSCAWPAPKTVRWFWRGTYYFTIINNTVFILAFFQFMDFNMCRLRWDTGDEKISSFAWGGAYAHRSSLDKYFQKYLINKIRVEFF